MSWVFVAAHNATKKQYRSWESNSTFEQAARVSCGRTIGHRGNIHFKNSLMCRRSNRLETREDLSADFNLAVGEADLAMLCP